MKGFLNKLFSKIVFSILLILLQLVWIGYITYRATALSNAFNVFVHVLSIVLALYVVNKETKPYNKLSWVFLILCLPVFGCPCYLILGRNGLTKKQARQMEESMTAGRAYNPPDTKAQRELREADPSGFLQSEYIGGYAGYPLCREVESLYFPSGEAMFEQLLKDIRLAEHYILIEYFILQPGKMLDSILELLMEKRRSGVRILLMYDDIGCIQTLPRRYVENMQSAGIECVRFNPFRPILSVIMNNRDHRKIFSIDGRIVYTGGVNLADEYINVKERFGYWKDAAIRITGRGAWSFSVMFLEMWNVIAKKKERYGDFAPPDIERSGETGQGYVQPFSDSPLDHEDVGENVYMNLIAQAQSYVYIFTPYLIISSEMGRILINAAKRGVDVRIITPGIPDKKYIYLLTQSNYSLLIEGGVKIYRFTPGFLHSKCLVCDDSYAVVGSINMDYRSFYLHFECAVLLYHSAVIRDIRADAEATFSASHAVSLDECRQKSFLMQLFLSVLHLFAPLL